MAYYLPGLLELISLLIVFLKTNMGFSSCSNAFGRPDYGMCDSLPEGRRNNGEEEESATSGRDSALI